MRAGDRATEFKQRCQGLGIEGVPLHSYRYAWAERAKSWGLTEPRFLKADFEQLVSLGLFDVEYNSQGDPLFCLTRNGLRYLQAIDGKAAPATS